MFSKSLPTPQIESLIFLPTNHQPRKVAIIAHPWARLGGSFNDRVVQSLLQIFLSSSVPTVIINSRGAGASTQTPSWTGKGEADDYAQALKSGMEEVWGKEKDFDSGEVFICGYSHGSLLALAQKPFLPPLKTYYLLVSPPLSVKWFLTPTLPMIVPNPSPPNHRPTVLAFHGTQDMFSSMKSIRSWAHKFDEQTVRLVEVEGDHFWTLQEGRETMDRAIRAWLLEEPRT